MLINPPQDGIINTALLLVLGSGERHAFLLSTTVLIREDNHEVLAAEVLHQLVGQTL